VFGQLLVYKYTIFLYRFGEIIAVKRSKALMNPKSTPVMLLGAMILLIFFAVAINVETLNCIAGGGEPALGMCIHSTTDAGKQCVDGSQCEGFCSAPSVQATVGVCSGVVEPGPGEQTLVNGELFVEPLWDPPFESVERDGVLTALSLGLAVVCLFVLVRTAMFARG